MRIRVPQKYVNRSAKNSTFSDFEYTELILNKNRIFFQFWRNKHPNKFKLGYFDNQRQKRACKELRFDTLPCGRVSAFGLIYYCVCAYHDFIERFILFHNKRRPKEMGAEEISAFLTDLAVKGKVSASTQNQAFFAVLFLYRDVLKINLPRSSDSKWLNPIQRMFAGSMIFATFSRTTGKSIFIPV